MVITFNPGPGQLSKAVRQDLIDIAHSPILTASHRGEDFVNTRTRACELIYEKLEIPRSYTLFLRPSATECMEAVLRNFVNNKSFHFVHGSFSQRFYDTAKAIGHDSSCLESAWEKAIPHEKAQIPSDCELIAIAHCETSTGLMWPWEHIARVRANNPNALMCIDATSTFGGVRMQWDQIDICMTSVQKCLGLPSGMAVLAVSPRAMEKRKEIQNTHIAPWQDLLMLSEKEEIAFSLETPNMLNIILLEKQLQRWDLKEIERLTLEKAALLYSKENPLVPYVEDELWRSKTSGNFICQEAKWITNEMKKAGFVLGAGYGPLKASCVRLAIFPAVDKDMLSKALETLREAFTQSESA